MTLQEKAFPTQSVPAAILVFDRKDGKALTEADSADVKSVVDGLTPKIGSPFRGIAAQPPAENKLVQIAVVGTAQEQERL